MRSIHSNSVGTAPSPDACDAAEGGPWHLRLRGPPGKSCSPGMGLPEGDHQRTCARRRSSESKNLLVLGLRRF